LQKDKKPSIIKIVNIFIINLLLKRRTIMKTKTIMKILTIVMIVAMIATMTSSVFAVDIPSAGGSVPTGMRNAAGQVITIVQFVCYAAAVVMLMVLGVKFISASPDGKAEIKKSAVIYVVGALLVFFAGLILGWIKDIQFTSK
jgi:hypothetical protein